MSGILRCEHTGNPCGSDMYMAGFPCMCDACVLTRTVPCPDCAALRAERDEARGMAASLQAAGEAQQKRHMAQLHEWMDRHTDEMKEMLGYRNVEKARADALQAKLALADAVVEAVRQTAAANWPAVWPVLADYDAKVRTT